MLKIGLIGYGKMGKTIHSLTAQHGCQVETIVSLDMDTEMSSLIGSIDVAIDFTSPDAALDHILFCFQHEIPIVCGTTGWWDNIDKVEGWCREYQGRLLYGGNFSLGVNMVFALNRQLAKWMAAYPEYRPSIQETHHLEKLDAPSGTAINMAQGIISENPNYKSWYLEPNTPAADKGSQIPVKALREPNVPGTHTIRWDSPTDEITLIHQAHNRNGFANGALVAAKWLVGQASGIYSMQDLLKSEIKS